MSLRSVWVAFAVAAATGLGASSSRLLGVHGVESALLLGVLLPPFVGAASAATTRRALGGWAPVSAATLFGRSFAWASAIWAVPVLILALNALRVPSCTPGEGLAFVVAGPGVGCALAAVVGTASAAWLRRGAVVVATLVPIASYGASVGGILSSPAIFAYDHFAGWFPGTLYDRGTTFPEALVTFRLVTALVGSAVVAATVAAFDPDRRRARLAHVARRPGLGALALGLAAFAAAGVAAGEGLGHRASVAGIVDALGTTVRGAHCVVHAPRELDAGLVALLVEDCDFRVVQAERRLGLAQPVPIRAFYFRDSNEKRRLMGAADTLVAKPWRNEVYLQLSGWPHPVVSHEVAHVVAGQAGRGPFRIATGPGGLVPDLALVEGTAVAVAFRTRGDLTPHQWSRAMLELDMLPPLESLRGLRFLLSPARDAYTVTGSFLRWAADTHGRGVLARAYRTGDIAAAVGSPLSRLEAEWRAFLRTVPLPDGALARARERFGRPTVFTTVCAHRIAHLERELGAARASGDLSRAVERADAILAIDAGETVARAARAEALARLGREREASEDLAVLEGATPPVRARALEGVADAAWARGDRDGAIAGYDRLLDAPRGEDALRSLELKTLALREGGAVAQRLFELLVERGKRPVPPAVAVHLARELDAARPDGLGAYLEGRQLHFALAWADAAQRLAEALARGLPTERLRVEARRLLGEARFAAGDLDGAADTWRDALRDEATDLAERQEAADWLERIRFARTRLSRPAASSSSS